MDNWYKFRKWT